MNYKLGGLKWGLRLYALMTKIQGSSDCGNSPKNKFAEQIAICIETGKVDELAPLLVPDFRWNNEDASEHPAAEFLDAVGGAAAASGIVIDRVVTHGRNGAVSGSTVSQQGSQARFCHIMQFANAKGTTLAAIDSFRKPQT